MSRFRVLKVKNIGPGSRVMSAQTEEPPEINTVSGEEVSVAAINNNAEEVEMATVNSTEETMKVVAHNNNVAQETCVVFVVKDTTTTDWQKCRYTYSLPLSTAVTDLYSAIAKEAGVCVCVCVCVCV